MRRTPEGPPRLRRRLETLDALREALDRGASIRLVLRREGAIGDEAHALLERARASGAAIGMESARGLRRLASGSHAPELIALEAEPSPDTLEALMAAPGLVLGLVGLRYPGNVGFVVRAAETAGAAGVVLAGDWAAGQREEAMRLGMRADRFLPVLDASAAHLVAAARSSGRRLIALETSGRATPWEIDWTSPGVLLAGSEAEGLPAEVLAAADEVVGIPMPGFVPSYNVQAAVGIALGEWLRQTRGGAP